MSSIMDVIGPEHLELFAFELGKFAELDFVYALASTNISQSVQNLIKMNTTLRAQVSLII